MTSKPGLALLLAGKILLLVAACTPNLNERRVSCPDSKAIESVHVWADRIVVKMTVDYQWHDLMKEPVRSYGLPPIDRETLRIRYSDYLRTATQEQQEYALSNGTLRLSLDRDKSGSDVHTTWRLYFKPDRSLLPDEVVTEELLACVAGLRNDDFDLVLMDSKTGRAKVSVEFKSDMVKKLTWVNLSVVP